MRELTRKQPEAEKLQASPVMRWPNGPGQTGGPGHGRTCSRHGPARPATVTGRAGTARVAVPCLGRWPSPRAGTARHGYCSGPARHGPRHGTARHAGGPSGADRAGGGRMGRRHVALTAI
uniref:Uncharacterized protein n=1 Tax=Oryza sativa subsp. japonica TaxID=39947 RepID=Q9FW14_ORYSJ|nr:hypothetical protein [Oryza sativa Japonica Group]